MGTLLPSTVTYRVSAFVNGSPLEDCGITGAGSEIQPYFINSVADDPDLAGLLVYLQTPGGVPVGERVRYALEVTERRDASGEEEAALQTASLAVSPAEAAPDETVIYVSRFDERLPAITLPEGLAIGRYTLVIRVLGLHETLYQAEKPVFFLDDADFALGELRYYRPGGEDSSILPPGVTVLLEAQVSTDPRLDPWLVWYNGKDKVSAMPVSGGFSRLLWKAPEQTGFQTLRAELFPYDPQEGEAGLNGYVKELSLPISVKYGNAEEAPGEGPVTLARYRLEGNLADSQSPGRELEAEGEGEDLWLPWNRFYGLALGPDRAYSLSLPPIPAGKSRSALRLLVSLAPLREGPVLSAALSLNDNPGASELDLSFVYAEGGIVLNWSAGPDLGSLRLSSGVMDEGALVRAAFDLTPDADGTGLILSLPGEGQAEEAGEAPYIPGRLGGQGSLRLGGAPALAIPAAPAAVEEAPGPVSETEAAETGTPPEAEEPEPSGPVFILDELSLSLIP
jgi:hypothetical protein